MTEILPSTFDQCTRLIELDVSWNGLTNIDNVRFPVSMTHLDINENDITTLGENFCGNMSLLEKLDVSGNEVTEILPSTFDQCTRLIELDVSGNRLTNIENVR